MSETKSDGSNYINRIRDCVEAGEVAARWGTYNIEALTVRGNSLGHSWRVAAMTIARDFAFSRKRCGHCQGPQLDEHRAKPDIQCARYYG